MMIVAFPITLNITGLCASGLRSIARASSDGFQVIKIMANVTQKNNRTLYDGDISFGDSFLNWSKRYSKGFLGTSQKRNGADMLLQRAMLFSAVMPIGGTGMRLLTSMCAIMSTLRRVREWLSGICAFRCARFFTPGGGKKGGKVAGQWTTRCLPRA